MTDRLNTLLENKTYDELSNEELLYIKDYITKAEYCKQRINILELKDAFDMEIDELIIDKTMMTELNNHLNSPSPSLYQKILNMQVSLIKVAAIFILIFSFYSLFLLKLDSNSSIDTISIKQSIIDTIP